MTPAVRRTFLDDDRQAQFERDGYVVMPFLTEDDIAYFSALVAELYPTPKDYFFNSAESFFTSAQNRPADPNFLRIHEEVYQRFRDRIDEHFDRHEIRHGYVMAKPPRSPIGVPLHQDEGYVLEPEIRGVLLWCPLIDTTRENGQLNVLVGSHKLLRIDRPMGLPPWPFRSVEDRIYHHLTPLEVKAGDIVAYDGALIHASPANRSDVVRPTVGIGLAPAEAQLICDFYDEAEDRVDRYFVRPEFYTHHELGVKPTSMYDRVEPRPWDPPTVTEADLDGWYGPDPGQSPDWEPFMTEEWSPDDREEFVAPPPVEGSMVEEEIGVASAPGGRVSGPSGLRRARRLAGRAKRRLLGSSTGP